MLIQLKIYNQYLKELVEKEQALPTKYINDIVNVIYEISTSLLILNQKNFKEMLKEEIENVRDN